MELPEDQRLKDISPKAYEHPADRAATAALQQIPMMDTVLRKVIEFGERSVLQSAAWPPRVRLGPDQLPEVWASHRASLARLDIDYVPDLYTFQFPMTNAMAIGSKKPIVVVNSGTISLMDEQELRTVLAHEAGHILSDHVLYQTALLILIRVRHQAAAAAAVLRRPAADRGRARPAGVVPRRRADAATARPRSSPAAR